MINTFVYGSLMFDPVWNVLIKNRYNKIDASLNGYKRVTVKGEVYPGLIESAEHAVNGVLVLDVAKADIVELDRFEGEYYYRHGVKVEALDGRLYQAETYVFRPHYRYLLSSSIWNVKLFREQGIKTFLAEYRGFMQKHQR